jgi:hypothetical protein
VTTYFEFIEAFPIPFSKVLIHLALPILQGYPERINSFPSGKNYIS